MAGFRVQFGANNSFVAWSDKDWVSSNVPNELDLKLQVN